MTETVNRDESPTAQVADESAALRDQQNRVWSHALHVDNGLIQRSNVYLVTQSILIGVYVVFALARPGTEDLPNAVPASLWVVVGAGTALAVLWLLGNHQQWRYVADLRRRCLALLPEYGGTWTDRRIGGSGIFITYAVPLVFVVLWIAAALQAAGVLLPPAA